jgi:hypothetical protein
MFLLSAALLLHLADRGNVIVKVEMRKRISICPNYREFWISDVRIIGGSLHFGNILS